MTKKTVENNKSLRYALLMKKMDKEIVLKALRRLGILATEEGLILEVAIYGGALMMLAYDSRLATKDVDAVIRPREVGQKLSRQVALEMNLSETWLNDDVRIFVAPFENLRELPIDLKGLQLTAPTADYLLAMKALACRSSLPGYEGDLEDLKFLIKKMEIHEVSKIQDAVDRYYPDDVILPHHQVVLQSLISEVYL